MIGDSRQESSYQMFATIKAQFYKGKKDTGTSVQIDTRETSQAVTKCEEGIIQCLGISKALFYPPDRGVFRVLWEGAGAPGASCSGA